MREKYLRRLKRLNSLEVYYDNKLIFSSRRHWLNPLFEFEDWLKHNPVEDRNLLSVHDAIDGKAAAVLTYRLGIARINSDIMSSLAASYFEKKGVEYHYSKIVDKILCITEDILTEEISDEEAYEMLSKRAGRK